MILRSLLRLLFWPGVILLGLMVGALSALIMIRQSPPTVGGWTTIVQTGAAKVDSYARARVALCCLLALHRKEATFFRADRDRQGRPLRANCQYRVTGRPPKARWWSLTVYGEDFFLIDTKYGRFSVNSGNTPVGANGAYTIAVGPNPAQGAWLPTKGDGQIYLLLRAYNPDPARAAAESGGTPSASQLPVINRIGKCA